MAGLFFVGFMGWAAAAPLDAAALISGTVTADGGPLKDTDIASIQHQARRLVEVTQQLKR